MTSYIYFNSCRAIIQIVIKAADIAPFDITTMVNNLEICISTLCIMQHNSL